MLVAHPVIASRAARAHASAHLHPAGYVVAAIAADHLDWFGSAVACADFGEFEQICEIRLVDNLSATLLARHGCPLVCQELGVCEAILVLRDLFHRAGRDLCLRAKRLVLCLARDGDVVEILCSEIHLSAPLGVLVSHVFH